MTEENQLIPSDLTGGAMAETFSDIVKSGNYIGRLQLFGSKSDACATGQIGIGRWGLVRDGDITDLSPEVDLVIVGWRAKALDTSGDALIIDFDPKSDTFADIKERSGLRDSGCMFGPEFLVWMPEQEVFATYFMSSKTARREAKKVASLVGKAATFKCHLIDGGKHKWHGPLAFPCSAPVKAPPEDQVRAEWTKFSNPPKSDVEIADDSDDASKRAR